MGHDAVHPRSGDRLPHVLIVVDDIMSKQLTIRKYLPYADPAYERPPTRRARSNPCGMELAMDER